MGGQRNTVMPSSNFKVSKVCCASKLPLIHTVVQIMEIRLLANRRFIFEIVVVPFSVQKGLQFPKYFYYYIILIEAIVIFFSFFLI